MSRREIRGCLAGSPSATMWGGSQRSRQRDLAHDAGPRARPTGERFEVLLSGGSHLGQAVVDLARDPMSLVLLGQE